MGKHKKKVGRPTNLTQYNRARNKGTTVPLEPLPIPMALKDALRGKDAKQILREAAPYCAQYLLNCIIGLQFKPSWSRVQVAQYVIDQVHGKAKISAEITGGGGEPLTWQQAVILAGIAEKMLADGTLAMPLPGGNGGQKTPTKTNVLGKNSAQPLINPDKVSSRALAIVEEAPPN